MGKYCGKCIRGMIRIEVEGKAQDVQGGPLVILHNFSQSPPPSRFFSFLSHQSHSQKDIESKGITEDYGESACVTSATTVQNPDLSPRIYFVY